MRLENHWGALFICLFISHVTFQKIQHPIDNYLVVLLILRR